MKKLITILFAIALSAVVYAQSDVVKNPSKYPVCSDRAAWAKTKVAGAAKLVSLAETNFERAWEPILFSNWKKFQQTGDKKYMKEREDNFSTLEAYIIAELTAGEGKYIRQIADYSWLQTTCPYWTAKDVLIEKAVVYFFKTELDAMDPSICTTIEKAVAKNSK